VSLIGLPLLVTSIVATLAGFAATVVLWGRGGRLRVPTRTVLILLCEALVIFSAAIVVNRSLDLYPSWSTLVQKAAPPPPPDAVADPATSLEVWLKARATGGATNGLVFDWKVAEASWHLATAPTVYVPPAYFTSTALRFPVVVVLAGARSGPAQAAWDPHRVAQLAHATGTGANPAVLVFLRLARPAASALLATQLPGRLDGALRVRQRGWAVIGIGGEAGTGLTALADQPARYWAGAVVADGGAGLSAAIVNRARKLRLDQTVLLVAPAGGGLGGSGAGKPSGTAGTGGSADPVTQDAVARPDDRLSDALRWAYQELPAPLAAPVTAPVGTAPAPTPAGTGASR
jgi:hypothetical protein